MVQGQPGQNVQEIHSHMAHSLSSIDGSANKRITVQASPGRKQVFISKITKVVGLETWLKG
jgi:hypothetical protein